MYCVYLLLPLENRYQAAVTEDTIKKDCSPCNETKVRCSVIFASLEAAKRSTR